MVMQKQAVISFFGCMFFSLLSMASDTQLIKSQPKEEKIKVVLCGEEYTCVECRLDYCETVYSRNPFLYVAMCLGLCGDRRIPNKNLIVAQETYDTAILQLKTATAQSEITDDDLWLMLAKIKEEQKKEDATSTMICCCDLYRESREKNSTSCCCDLCECYPNR